MSSRLPFHDDEAFASWSEISDHLAANPVDTVLNTLVLLSVAVLFVVGLFAGPKSDWSPAHAEPASFFGPAKTDESWRPAPNKQELLSWSCEGRSPLTI
ncbi:hypothetical protein IMF23_18795 [Chelatococcus daeguensis]|uniref:Uncharacterized protein n=2 Tax=Chelatococcus TaxID=28209 RepID=A0AAC9JP57_9HYPH|nr:MULTISPECIES: hypothetical protein [Chelatococcus]APF37557.1 hypothetical protein BOQ54_09630 [Chelatococcus daeguensis]KZE35493.1 hypothetical protein AVW15_14720 [Chelatococcus daeguensis]MBM3085492.1 hypothetical protein [Chelatococcus daeguensis]CUA86108.1 hypothetical protein Ga0061061_102372 [Chelatococcus sambhunathii]